MNEIAEKIDARVKRFADAIVPILSIPEIFPNIAIEDLPKISKELEKILNQEETHGANGSNVCKHFSIGVTYVCGLDIVDIKFMDLLKIMNKENETEKFIQYVKYSIEHHIVNSR